MIKKQYVKQKSNFEELMHAAEIGRINAEKKKLELECKEIEKRLFNRWFERKEIFQTIIVLVAALQTLLISFDRYLSYKQEKEGHPAFLWVPPIYCGLS